MHEVLVATPLKCSLSQPYLFSNGISIRELSPILWDISNVKGYISDVDRERMAKSRYWLCASNEYEHVDMNVGNELYAKARYAAWAIQITCPTRRIYVLVVFQYAKRGCEDI